MRGGAREGSGRVKVEGGQSVFGWVGEGKRKRGRRGGELLSISQDDRVRNVGTADTYDKYFNCFD